MNQHKKTIKKQHDDFVKDFVRENPDWAKERRIEFLEGETKTLNKKILFWIKIMNRFSIGWFSSVINDTCISPVVKQLDRIYREIDMYKNPKPISLDEISEEEIEIAKQYPFEDLIESKKNFALCPFHDDHHASFYIKGNFGYCFSCGKSVDTIQFVMETRSVGFKEAVKFLQ